MAVPHHPRTPKSQRSENRRSGTPVFGEATGPCIYGCNYVASDSQDLANHAIEKHGLRPPAPKVSKEEKAKRDLMLSAIWMNACPHCGQMCQDREQLMEHTSQSHNDDLSGFAVELNA